MKKIYVTPVVLTTNYIEPEMLCLSRQVSGGPTKPEDGGISIPGTVGETDGELDPYSDEEGNGHGQGSGGSGNRAPERWGSLW